MTYNQSTSNNAQTFMIGDIQALQQLYGANYNTHNGDNVYSWNSSSGATFNNGNVMVADNSTDNVLMSIWDGGGEDTYDLSAYASSVTVDLRAGGETVLASNQLVSGNGGTAVTGNIFNALLFNGSTASLIENAIGGSAADTVWGNATANKVWAGGGADAIFGNSGADILRGEAGSDTIYAGNGDDVLYGGSDAGVLDYFMFEGTGNDKIKDFQNGVDKIGLGDSFSSDYATLYASAFNSANGLVLNGSAGNTITVEGMTKAQFTADDILDIVFVPPAPDVYLV